MQQLKKWCHLYQDRDTGETIKVKGDTDTHLPSNGGPVPELGYNPDVIITGNRNHPSLVGRRLRYLGIGTVCVTGFEASKTVPKFSYATVHESDSARVN
jgi:hypothetical protein